ncbi:hypothetical protein VST7929_03039 [Vibrio stylophorae]|uniref:Exonuclease domain-containing protein n=1 Tax=Vibrio stylophorae TaxID=659351 RepID=A0ABN8DZ69_9VIBR|nr:exonuclease domain-containing protein [Vibrio stylophorae]CAH0535465.1 hypothetical protein VST7929_03039 [Vibrio stylophorae]
MNIYLDTETTGLDDNAEIIEISIISESGHVLLDTLVKPSQTVSAEATAIHGITDADLVGAPTWPEIKIAFFISLSNPIITRRVHLAMQAYMEQSK